MMGRCNLVRLPPVSFNNDLPPDYENCKKHLPTLLIFIPSLHDFQPSVHNTKPETSGDFTRTVIYELTRV